MAAGFLPRWKNQSPAFWERYSSEVVNRLRTFRVYGLQVERAVVADLPSLFVPLRLAHIADYRKLEDKASGPKRDRRSVFESELSLSNEIEEPSEPTEGLDLARVLAEHRRFALIGGPGSGKTTTLKWLALVAAIEGTEGRKLRQRLLV